MSLRLCLLLALKQMQLLHPFRKLLQRHARLHRCMELGWEQARLRWWDWLVLLLLLNRARLAGL